MVSVRKRKMKRSGVSKNTRRNKDRQRKVNLIGNPIIAAHWDNALTVTQNYKKMGLTLKLSKSAGGTEKELIVPEIQHDNMEESLFSDSDDKEDNNDDGEDNEFAGNCYDPANILEGTAKVIKDNEGNIVKIVYGIKKIVNETKRQEASGIDVNKTGEQEEKTEVIKELELLASQSKPHGQLKTSKRESEWLAKLYAKYGDNYEKMKWDKVLNPFQQSPGNLKKKFIKWKKEQVL